MGLGDLLVVDDGVHCFIFQRKMLDSLIYKFIYFCFLSMMEITRSSLLQCSEGREGIGFKGGGAVVFIDPVVKM